MCASHGSTCNCNVWYKDLDVEEHQELCGYTCTRVYLLMQLTWISQEIRFKVPATHARPRYSFTKMRKIFYLGFRRIFMQYVASTYLDLRAIIRREAVRSGDDRQARHCLLQRLALARRAIVGISFPTIPWPMTLSPMTEAIRVKSCEKNLQFQVKIYRHDGKVPFKV